MTMADVLAWAPHVLTAGALFFAWWSRQADRKRDEEKRAEDQKRDDERRAEEDRRWKAEREHEAERLRRETDGTLRALEVERDKFRAEAERWRSEKRDTKRAEVAGELAGAIQRFVIAMDTIADMQIRETLPNIRLPDGTNLGESPEAERKLAAATYGKRWNDAAPTFNAFIDAWNLANVYLPSEINALCSELWSFKASVQANQQTWLVTMGQRGADPSFWAKGVGPNVHRRGAELNEKALELLRPLAQLGEIWDAKPIAVAPARARVADPEPEAGAVPVVDQEGDAAPGGPTVEADDDESADTNRRRRR